MGQVTKEPGQSPGTSRCESRCFSQHPLSHEKLEVAPYFLPLPSSTAAASKCWAGLLPCLCDLLIYSVKQKSMQ